MIASAGESRPPHVSAWASYHSTPRPSCGLWRERHPTEPWHARRILAPRPGASLPHFQRPLGPTARIGEYLAWLAEHDPGFDFEIDSDAPRRLRYEGLRPRYEVVGCDRIVIQLRNGRIKEYVHSWGELLVRPAHGYGISASRPFALPLIFIGGYEHPTAAGRALAAIPYDPGLQAKRDATAELLADAGR